MAPLVSPVLFLPLSSRECRGERAGVPAGKQCGPIVARPHPRRTNRRRARRAKMNGSLSPSVLLSLRSSFSPIPRTLFPHLGFHASLTRTLAYTRRAPSVRRSVRSPHRQCSRARHVALYSATFQRLTRYSLSSSRLLSIYLYLSLSSFLSPSLSFYLFLFLRLDAVFLSRSYAIFVFSIPSKLLFFFSFRSYKAALFFDFLLRTRYSLPFLFCISFRILKMRRLYS